MFINITAREDKGVVIVEASKEEASVNKIVMSKADIEERISVLNGEIKDLQELLNEADKIVLEGLQK
jgi:tRNA1(Val) A37 N6-methylase TrmN6